MPPTSKPPCDTGVILSGTAGPICSRSAKRWTLVAAILGSSLAFVDGTVVNVALPAIQQQLDTTTAGAQWVMESFALLLSALLLVGGAMGDRFGRRRIFMLGVIVFTLASVGCALSPNITTLIIMRGVQGLGAALLVPGSLALISAAYPQDERGAAIGTWSAFSGITAALGPVLGGFLVEHYSWIWAFLINVPVGAVILIICVLKISESFGASRSDPIDVRGASWITLGLAGIVFALIESPVRGWASPSILISAVVGIVGFGLFIRAEARARSPMLPLRLFRERKFAAANSLTLLLYAALGGSLFFLPLNLIQVQGYGATAAGAALIPFIAIMFLLSRWAGHLVDRFGARPPLVVGPTIAAAGFALFTVPSIGDSYWTGFFPAVCVLGLGMSITVAPLTTTVMNAVGTDRAGTASGVNNAIARAAGLLAIAVFGVALTAAYDARLMHELSGLHLPRALLESVIQQRDKLAGTILPKGTSTPVAAELKQAIGMAFVSGFRQVMWISASMALASALSAGFFMRSRSDSK